MARYLAEDTRLGSKRVATARCSHVVTFGRVGRVTLSGSNDNEHV